MSLLKKVGAAAGIGAAGVDVILEAPAYAWGERVRGTIRVRGGAVPQDASEIRVSVEEHWETRDSEGDRDQHYYHHNETVLARNVRLEPGSEQEWTFEIYVPPSAAPSHDWSIAARVSVPRAADRHGKREFELLLPAAFRGASAVLLAAVDVEPYTTVVNGNTVDLDFRPSKGLKKDLDGVRMTLSLIGGEVSGTLEINPQEKSVGDFLKSLVKKDRVRHELHFTAEELAAAAYGTPPAETVSRLRTLIQPFLS